MSTRAMRQYSQIIEEKRFQLVASCFGRSSYRGDMVSHMHNVFCSFSAAEYLQVSATLQKSQSLLRCATWSVKLLCSGEMTIQKQYIFHYLAFAETRWKIAKHRERSEADSALVLNVQRISRFLIECKKSTFSAEDFRD